MSEIDIKARVYGKLYSILLAAKQGEITLDDAVEQILQLRDVAVVDREANREFYDEGHQVEVEIPKGWVKEVRE